MDATLPVPVTPYIFKTVEQTHNSTLQFGLYCFFKTNTKGQL